MAFSREMNGVDHQADNTTSICSVQPKHLYRKPLPDGVKSELHAVAVFSLAGAIRQISSLAKHAESLLGELCDAMTDIHTRSVLLDSRVVRLKENILPKLNVDEEAEISLSDYLEVDIFKSDCVISQQLVSIQTAPEALTQQYRACDPKPDLQSFTPLFGDGRKPMNLYSNPEFFFTSWRLGIEKQARKARVKELAETVEAESTQSSDTVQIDHSKTSNCSTLPSRGRSRDKNMPAAIQAYSSMRDKKNQKKRATLKDDTFLAGTPGGERSESSGYLSQHSSFNSLLDNESAGSICSQDGRVLSTTPSTNGTIPTSKLHNSISENNSISAITHQRTWSEDNGVDSTSLGQPIGVANGKPKVPNNSEDNKSEKMYASQNSLNSVDGNRKTPKMLHKMRTSSRSDNKHDPQYIKDIHARPPMSPLLNSPRKWSAPVTSSIGSPRDPRKTSLATPTISPGASPEIRRRAESITQQLMDISPELGGKQKRHSGGVFQFPDPLDVLNSPFNASPQLGMFQTGMEDVSPDDFPPMDSQLLDRVNNPQSSLTTHNNRPSKQQQELPKSSPGPQRRQRHKTFGGVVRRQAPSPPKKKETNLDSIPANTTSKLSEGSVVSLSQTKTSPPSRRHSMCSNGSLITPRRKAPPPPSSAGSKGVSPLEIGIENPLKEDNEVVFKRQVSSEYSKLIPRSESIDGLGKDKIPRNTPKSVSFPATLPLSNGVSHSITAPQQSQTSQQSQSKNSKTTPSNSSSVQDQKVTQFQTGMSQAQNQISTQSQTQNQTHQAPRGRSTSLFSRPNRSHNSTSDHQPQIPNLIPDSRTRLGSASINVTSTKPDQSLPTGFQTQAPRSRVESVSDRPVTTTRYAGSLGASDKIAETLRAKAKQRKQKSEDKKNKNTNQILKGLGVNTTITEERSDLLRAIRKGIELNNVLNQEKKDSTVLPWDVAAILERRHALETPSDNELDEGAVNDTEWDEM